MSGEEYGIKNGWFNYPKNFDPVWSNRDCANYTPKGDSNES